MSEINGFPILTVGAFADRLLALSHPVVLTHARPDGDTVGTAAAMCHLLRSLGKDAVYASEEELPERLRFVTEGLERTEDLTGREPVAVDVASPEQLGLLAQKTGGAGSVVLALDHHALGQPFAPCLLRPDASSAGEVLFEVTQELERRGLFTMTKEVGAALYTAISSDTGGFRFANTSAHTLRVAARLLESGIDAAYINHRLFFCKSLGQLRAEGYVAEHLRTVDSYPIAFAVVDAQTRLALHLSPEEFESAIDVVRSLEGTQIALLVKESDRGEYRASLRSTGMDVAAVAAHFGGGGHTRAAGCTPKAKSAEEAAQKIITRLCAAYDREQGAHTPAQTEPKIL